MEGLEKKSYVQIYSESEEPFISDAGMKVFNCKTIDDKKLTLMTVPLNDDNFASLKRIAQELFSTKKIVIPFAPKMLPMNNIEFCTVSKGDSETNEMIIYNDICYKLTLNSLLSNSKIHLDEALFFVEDFIDIIDFLDNLTRKGYQVYERRRTFY